MKKLLLLITFTGLWLEAFAQEPVPLVSRVGVSFGLAAPLGDFSSTSFYNEMSPFAGPGCIATVFYTRQVLPNIALGATAGLQHNPFALNEFVSPADELVKEKEAKAWRSYTTMADTYLQSSSGNFTAYIKGSAGVAFNRSAHLHIQTDFGDIKRSAANATSFAYAIGGGLHQGIKKVGIALEASLLTTKPTFEVEDAHRHVTRYSQAMNSFQISLGLTYSTCLSKSCLEHTSINL